MGHSRRFIHSADKDLTRRSKTKNASSGENNSESTAAELDKGKSEEKRVLYHCNYCNKDITGKIRIKCYTCPDFDLCVECFSVGAEVTPHKSNHPYRVMDNLSFPLFCPDWNADNEMLLLEGIEMFGLGNWAEVSEHVGTKSIEECKEHYTNIYLNSPNFPLPDTSPVVGKNKKELLAMAKGRNENKKGFPTEEFNLEEESPFSPSRIIVEDIQKGGASNHLLSSLNSDAEAGICSSRINATSTSANKKPSNVIDNPGVVKGTDGPSLVELSGYNPKRQEFNIEYDDDAEKLLVDMEFKDSDTEDERELKLRVLRIYSKRLDERKKRKDFIIERNLLYQNAFGKDLSPEERAICWNYDTLVRFHSKEEHEEFLKSVIEEHRTLKRIQELKEAKAAGYRTKAEADRYLEQKKKGKSEENARRGVEVIGEERQAQEATSSSSIDMDRMRVDSADLLSGAETRLCSEIGLSPPIYLKMLEVMSVEIFFGNITKKSDAYHLFKIEPDKIDRVYEMLIKKGIAQP